MRCGGYLFDFPRHLDGPSDPSQSFGRREAGSYSHSGDDCVWQVSRRHVQRAVDRILVQCKALELLRKSGAFREGDSQAAHHHLSGQNPDPYGVKDSKVTVETIDVLMGQKWLSAQNPERNQPVTRKSPAD